MAERRRVHFWVSGRVQGVGFRYHTQVRATELGLLGWVRNLADGRVEVVAEGPRAQIEKLVEWCRKGPPSAKVVRLEGPNEELSSDPLAPFSVR